MESFATPYPVFFLDDDGETKPCGVIGVHSVLTFKRFQALMSQKTNLPANQLSAVFVCRRTVRLHDAASAIGNPGCLAGRSRLRACAGPRRGLRLARPDTAACSRRSATWISARSCL